MPHFFSQSEINCAQTCWAMYNHRYNKRVYMRKRPSYFIAGEAVHLFLQRYYETQDKEVAKHGALEVYKEVDTSSMGPKEIQELENDKHRLLGAMGAYPDTYPIDFEKYPKMMLEVDCLKEKGIEIAPDIFFCGKIDGLWKDANGAWWVAEHKYLSQDSESWRDAMSISHQTLGYMHLAKKVVGEFPKGVLYNVILKTKIRQRLSKNESALAFRKRVENEYRVNAGNYFHRHPIIPDPQDLEDWLREMRFTTRSVLAMKARSDQAVWPKSTSSCQGMFGRPCDYLDACRKRKYNRLVYRVPGSDAEKEEFKQRYGSKKKGSKQG